MKIKQLVQALLNKVKLRVKQQMGKKEPTLLYPAHTVKRKPPFNYQESDKQYFAHEFSHDIRATYLHEMENVSVYTNTGVVFQGLTVLADSSVLHENVGEEFTFYHYIFTKLKGKKIQLSHDEKYVIANNSWAHGFFHWILDTLPRLYAIKDLTKDLIIILPKSYQENDIKKGWTPFHLESLLPFQFKAILEVEANVCTKVPHLIMPSHTAESGNYNVEIMQGLRKMYHDFFIRHYEKPVTQLGDKIYVTRKKALWRKVKNDDEVIPLMESYGFTIVNLEDYTFAQKVQIAYHARYVVGIFSSGQTIATFMQKDSFLLDLRPKDAHNLSIYSLCDALEVNYLYQFCEYVDVQEGDYVAGQVAPQAFNLLIDTKKLQENIEKILS